MDIPINAPVNCSDGPAGRSTQLILNPTSEEITHLIVNNGLFPETEYLVSVGLIAECTPALIQLTCTREELSKMPIFNQVEFIPFDLTGLSAGPYMMWPYYASEGGFVRIEKEHIPADELAIRRSAAVVATDGTVGHIDKFLMNPENDHITHLVLREGHFWGQKKVTIPAGQIDRFEKNAVYLKLSKHEISTLPAIPVRSDLSKKV